MLYFQFLNDGAGEEFWVFSISWRDFFVYIIFLRAWIENVDEERTKNIDVERAKKMGQWQENVKYFNVLR